MKAFLTWIKKSQNFFCVCAPPRKNKMNGGNMSAKKMEKEFYFLYNAHTSEERGADILWKWISRKHFFFKRRSPPPHTIILTNVKKREQKKAEE